MGAQQPRELITPPNMLKVKVGGSLDAIGKKAIARADMALKAMSTQFVAWLEEEVEALAQAITAACKNWNEETLETVFSLSHNLKGQAATYGSPIVGRIASSLCQLLTDEDKRTDRPKALVAAHLDSMRLALRDDIKEEDDPRAQALIKELETVTLHLAPKED